MQPTEIKEKLEFSNESLYHLNSTRKWTMFLSVLGMIFVGFMLIIAVLMITGGIVRSLPANSPMPGFMLGGMGFLYIIIAILYFFPIYFLLQFSIYSKRAIIYKDEEYLATALKNIKNHYMFIGVLTIIGIAFYLIFFLAFGFGALLHH